MNTQTLEHISKHLIFLFIAVSCFALKSNAQITTMEKKAIILPEIDSSFEKFDIEEFNERKKNRLTHEQKNDSLTIYTGGNAGYSIAIYLTNSYFGIVKNYYKKNGNIEIKGISFNHGSEYGIWYKFDEQGNLIETIDTDAGYDFTWEQVIHYCEENKIKLIKGYKRSGFKTKIYKEESEEGNKIWVITYQISGDQLIELTLDGKTGEELKRKEIGFINH